MPGPRNTLLIEGTFRELVEELADYIDNIRKSSSETITSLRTDLSTPLDQYTSLEETSDASTLEAARDAVLKIVVNNSSALSAAPEREFVAAYNLLIHLIHQSSHINEYLQPICRSLSSDPVSSPTRFGLALTVLSTIFNVLSPDDSIRYPVFDAALDVISKSGSYETLTPQLKHLDGWLTQWKVGEAQQRRLYLRVSGIAREAGENEEGYEYLIKALRTIPTSEVSGEEAQKLSLDALKTALESPTHFDFEDLTSLDSVQALRSSNPVAYDLLEIFTSNVLEDYNEFKSALAGWIEEQNLDDNMLVRKMRLLTLASLAASSGQSRTLTYANIASALQVDSSDVETWVIDVIRAGLVEGKLSQLNQTFLIHRSTYRVFTQTQWREVAGRLDMWRSSLVGVLEIIKQERDGMLAQREAEARAAEAKVNGFGGDRGGNSYRRAAQREAVDVGMD